MQTQQPDSLAAAVGRIWAQTRATGADIDGLFERMIQSFYSKMIRAGDVVVDGGAHTGRHTIPLARLVGEGGLVVAFEPLPSAAAGLSQLLAGAGLGARVQLRREALGHARGRHDFFIVNNMLEFSGLVSRTYPRFVADETRIEVDVETIDAAIGARVHAGPVSFIKLDVEGTEFRALQGAEQTLRTQRPCCVFENGLGLTAADYESEEFFGYFRRVGYELYDIFGCQVHECLWDTAGPLNFVALHASKSHDLLPLLWTSVLEEMLTSSWTPGEPLGPSPAAFASTSSSSGAAMTGYVDRFETLTKASGWAGDPGAGQPPRSLAITVDGRVVGTVRPGKPRYDVSAATGHPGLSESGFEFTLRTESGVRVEIHAERPDGTFVKLGPPAS